MAKKVVQEEATVEVTGTVLGKAQTQIRKVKVRPFITDVARVGVKYGLSKEVGDGNWVRVDVSIECPCYKEEMVEVYNQLQDLGDKLIEMESDRITGGK